MTTKIVASRTLPFSKVESFFCLIYSLFACVGVSKYALRQKK